MVSVRESVSNDGTIPVHGRESVSHDGTIPVPGRVRLVTMERFEIRKKNARGQGSENFDWSRETAGRQWEWFSP